MYLHSDCEKYNIVQLSILQNYSVLHLLLIFEYWLQKLEIIKNINKTTGAIDVISNFLILFG